MNAMDVFERAMHLSDNGDEDNYKEAASSEQSGGDYFSENKDIGLTDTDDNEEYKRRTLAIINTIINELYPYSDTAVRTAGKRTVYQATDDATRPYLLTLDEEINLDAYCMEVLAYGLAGRLFTDENPTQANFYVQEYERRLAYLKSGEGMLSGSEDIEDVYGSGFYDDDGNYMRGYPFQWVARW